MQLGLVCAGMAFLYLGWASWDAGYAPEVAIVRGFVGFMAVSLLGYVGELIVATAAPRSEPPQRASRAAGEPASSEAAAATPVLIGRGAGLAEETGGREREAPPPALPEQERRAA